MDNYSDSLERVPHCKITEEALLILNQFPDFKFGGLVKLDHNHIGLLCKLFTDAPSNSCLKAREPILISLSESQPLEEQVKIDVYPDRLDFPFAHFPHINPKLNQHPRSICLVREDFNDWYCEHTFGELLSLIRAWFDDALNDNLVKIKEGDSWEPLYLGTPDTLYFRCPIFDDTLQAYEEPYQLPFEVPEDFSVGPIDYNTNPGKAILGLLLFRGASKPLRTWIHERPKNIADLFNLIESYEVWSREELINKIIEKKSTYTKIIIQIGFARPQLVIGKTNKVDYICFKTDIDSIINQKAEEKVELVQIIDLPTPQFARRLSKTNDNIGQSQIAIIGCGAIGSKLSFHLFRAGFEKLTLIDSDTMLPHNYLRHALTYGVFRTNKASLLAKTMKMFLPRFGGGIKSNENDALGLIKNNQIEEEYIIDCSASASVLRTLDQNVDTNNKKIVRVAISDGGKIGLVYFNGSSEVGLSDYYMYLLRVCLTKEEYEEDLGRWFRTEANYTLDRLRIGEGCHSNTMILSDDLISTHAGIASNLIRNHNYTKRKNEIFLSFLDYDWPGSCHTERFEVAPFHSFSAGEEWVVRIPEDLKETIYKSSKSSNKETGGYLFGTIDYKHKTLYVLHSFEPRDTKKYSTRLRLGVKGLKEEISRIKNLTADSVHYLGDWHSHPNGSIERSDIDMATSNYILSEEMDNNFVLTIICNGKDLGVYVEFRE